MMSIIASVNGFQRIPASLQALFRLPRLIGLGLAMLSVSWFTYDPERYPPFLRFPRQGTPDYSDISYALFVFVWVCAWGYLALNSGNKASFGARPAWSLPS